MVIYSSFVVYPEINSISKCIISNRHRDIHTANNYQQSSIMSNANENWLIISVYLCNIWGHSEYYKHSVLCTLLENDTEIFELLLNLNFAIFEMLLYTNNAKTLVVHHFHYFQKPKVVSLMHRFARLELYSTIFDYPIACSLPPIWRLSDVFNLQS